MSHKNKDHKFKDLITATRKGSRDAELEFECGFTSRHKVHKSAKSYSRKPKHKSFYK